MATVLNVPSTEDFTGYQGLVAKQGEHLAPMVTWAGKECMDTDGLTGVLSVLVKPIVPTPANYIGAKLSQCQRGMGAVKDKIATVDRELRAEDDKNATDLKKIFPDQISGFPDIGSLPTISSEAADFTDEDVVLKEPTEVETTPTSQVSEPTIKKSIKSLRKKNKKAAKEAAKNRDGDGSSSDDDSTDAGNSKSGLGALAEEHISNWTKYLDAKMTGSGQVLWLAEKGYKMVTGHSLIDTAFKPIAGDWDRLIYLHDAYDTLGDGCYTVAGTLRKASWKIGSEWKGDTATAFDSYMFRWTMGIGGVGDLAKLVAKAYKEAHDLLLKLIGKLVDKLSDMIDTGIKKLAVKIAEMLAGDAIIETVGLGPEDPVADVVAVAYSAEKMYEIYKLVRTVVNDVIAVVEIYKEIKTAIEKLRTDIDTAVNSLTHGSWPSVGSVVADVETKGFDFEKSGSSSSGSGSWDAAAGVGRLALLPQM
ncbi:hypothetical protein [Nocardia vaccinii]|uniref:hypothetical protein n=1 Tax=Nocardia vaccinii TaxID=1822 RepID=UPI000836F41D|nr:hypothetical protein [Nocardia vaccinii]